MNALPRMSGSPRKMSFESDPPELIAYEVDPWDGGDRGNKGKKGKKDKKDKKGNTKTFENPVDEVDNPVADEWPRDKQGRMVLDKRKGREMVSGIAELYTHLRKSSVKDPSVRDSYGLWMHLDDSEDEGGGSDENEEQAGLRLAGGAAAWASRAGAGAGIAGGMLAVWMRAVGCGGPLALEGNHTFNPQP